MSETKEHPIIFSSGMVRSILDGRKTQTRRVIKINKEAYKTGGRKCPYGEPSARLWVRETFALVWPGETQPKSTRDNKIEYRADLPVGCTDYPGQWPADEARGNDDAPKWTASIFMPRWASRINLEIKNIRVERVQEIREKDAKAEGIAGHADNLGSRHSNPTMIYPAFPEKDGGFMTARAAYEALWDSLNKKRGYGWDVNPWVWVIEFQMVSQPVRVQND
ncbi:MAG TPA: hypothetical protein VKF38_09820 [Anaerolineaceae bacterium]|nr:hypothetical protein [Anaerolineaceae bacterium]